MEERLKFLSQGVKPRKNKDAMNEVIEELKKEGLFYGDKVRVKREDGDESEEEAPKKEKKEKKEKKDKKEKKEGSEGEEGVEKEKKEKK
jgi:hypothetical protein